MQISNFHKVTPIYKSLILVLWCTISAGLALSTEEWKAMTNDAEKEMRALKKHFADQLKAKRVMTNLS